MPFKIQKRNFAVVLSAYGIPILTGFTYFGLAIYYDEIALFTSTVATQTHWYVLGVTAMYVLCMSTTQVLQIILIVNYSVKSSGHNLVTSLPTDSSQTAYQASEAFDAYIEHLIQTYREKNKQREEELATEPLQRTQSSSEWRNQESSERPSPTSVSMLDLNADPDFAHNEPNETALFN